LKEKPKVLKEDFTLKDSIRREKSRISIISANRFFEMDKMIDRNAKKNIILTHQKERIFCILLAETSTILIF